MNKLIEKRVEILNWLLNFDKPIEEINKMLSEFPWDSKELVILEPTHINKVLSSYLSKNISEEDVEQWASAIECRDDIGFFNDDKTLLNLIHELANPYLTQPLTPDLAKSLLNRLIKRIKKD